MSMDKLSPEIVSLVVSHFLAKPQSVAPILLSRPLLGRLPLGRAPTKPQRGPYTLSRTWQRAVETHTFASIRLKSTELSEFAAIFSDVRRQRLLRHLTFVVCLPTHGDSREDHATNVAAFTDALKDLLGLLAQWDQNAAGGEALPDLKLWLWFAYDIRSEDGPVDHHFNAEKSSAARRYLDGNFDGFPLVQRISSFKIDVSLGKAPHPGTICRIAGLFPRLQELDIEYRDPAIKRREMRREHRLALAAGLKDMCSLLGLTKLHVRRQGGWDPRNHSFTCQDLEDEEHIDPLCESIRQVAEQGRLTDLKLNNVLVSPDLFRNRRSGAVSEDRPMPALRRLHIEDGIISPSGKWYYTGNPNAVEAESSRNSAEPDDEDDELSDSDSEISNDEDDTDRDVIVNGERPVHMWRTRPDPETFDPLIADMATALQRMPALERACLDIGGNLEGSVAVIIQCVQRGQGFFMPPDRIQDTEAAKQVARCKAWVGAATEWEVPREATAAWKAWVGEEGQTNVARWG
ncbi:hypothetical protein PFICI_12926 [Pestalotiopsis fici W106-1]|uniref:Uncharacterized protein n=1 Tax=Pestalotiopsis fici (strain W106-1 / CGMCC3.15140) TaxID=1229662 RepID=W3WS42_PESFW|nr:uncharacterized protein PFICI_12926 [Pestalotiopsis fici W106-1]ETS75982.1 hypothetical protein PFICI_12926 [Pestalotiopsis fici W106-1]